jgi:DNA-binding GntR family transcriptional regulator
VKPPRRIGLICVVSWARCCATTRKCRKPSSGEHVAILDDIIAGNAAEAESLSRNHISRAAKIFVQRLQAQKAASEEEMRQRRTRRIR